MSGFCFGIVLTPPLACNKPKGKRHKREETPQAKREKPETEADEGIIWGIWEGVVQSVKWVLKDEGQFADTNASEKKAIFDLISSFHDDPKPYVRGKEATIMKIKTFRIDYQKSYEDFVVLHVQKNIKIFPSTVAAAHVEIQGGNEVIEKQFVADALKKSFENKKICFLHVHKKRK